MSDFGKNYRCLLVDKIRGSLFHRTSLKQDVLKVNKEGVLFYEILMDCVARKEMQKTTSSYLKCFPRYCDLNFYMLSH